MSKPRALNMARVSLLLLLLLLVACGGQKHKEKGLEFRDWYVVKPVAGASNSVAYGTIRNTSPERVILARADFSCATDTALHETITSAGRARMLPLGEVGIDPGATVVFEPGHKHVMLTGLKDTGEQCPTVFSFSLGKIQFSMPLKVREK